VNDMSDQPGWSEADSQSFIDFGRYFVPERERQTETICALIPAAEGPFTVLELACGEGLLAEAILERHPGASVVGLDLSPAMRERAAARLARFGERFVARPFDLAERGWRADYRGLRAVVSSLTIHHLDGAGKRGLFADIHAMLAPGGALVVADVVEAATPEAAALFADAWDAEVRRRALELDGRPDAFDFFVRERWNMYRHPEPGGYDKPSPLADQLAWLREAGFADVDVYWALAGHAIFGGRRSGE